MHYSRVSVTPSRRYSAATAVLMNEILKGIISLVIAFIRIDIPSYEMTQAPLPPGQHPHAYTFFFRLRKLWSDVSSPDGWKLSIPAILYGKFCPS
jgi:UDP-sugar transporter A1/2/3